MCFIKKEKVRKLYTAKEAVRKFSMKNTFFIDTTDSTERELLEPQS